MSGIRRFHGSPRARLRAFLAATVLCCAATPALAASVAIEILGGGYDGDPGRLPSGFRFHTGDVLTLTFRVKGARVTKPFHPSFPDGVVLSGSGLNPQPHWEDFNFFVTLAHSGSFRIAPFTIHADNGESLNVHAFVLNAGR